MTASKAVVVALGNYNMIPQRNTQKNTRRNQLLRRLNILTAWTRIAGWMIVRHNHTGCPVFKWPCKYFTRMHKRRRKRVNRHHPASYEAVSAIQRQANNIFLLFSSDKLEMRQDIIIEASDLVLSINNYHAVFWHPARQHMQLFTLKIVSDIHHPAIWWIAHKRVCCRKGYICFKYIFWHFRCKL